ncbi:MAG: hypothetical protein AAF664_02255 [Planctomycetota bacterium]
MMKSDQSMTRADLLCLVDKCIESETNAMVSTPKKDSFDNAFRELISQLKENAPETQKASGQPPQPIPMTEVAAYVDGTLIDPTRESSITLAAMHDSGLLMEILFARQSHFDFQGSSRRETVSTDLRTDLTSLFPKVACDVEARTVKPIDRAQVEKRRGLNRVVGLAIVIAATLLLAVGYYVMFDEVEVPDSIAGESGIPGGQTEVLPIEAGRFEGIKRQSESTFAKDATHSRDPASMDAQVVTPDVDKAEMAAEIDKLFDIDGRDALENRTVVMGDQRSGSSEPIGADEEKPGGDSRMMDSGPSRIAKAVERTEPATFREMTPLRASWSRIDGVLVRSAPNTVMLASGSSDLRVRGVSEESSQVLASDDIETRVRFETLPLCRAVADLSSGGRLVVSSSSRLEFDSIGNIDLQHGAIALLDLDDSSVVGVRNPLGRRIRIEPQEGSSLVVRRTIDGIQIDALDDGVRLNGELFAGSTIDIDQETMRVTSVANAPKTLPRWTKQTVDRIEVGRAVLASIAESDDIERTLTEQIAVSRNVKQSRFLGQWLLNAKSDSVVRFLGSQNASLREAAFRYLVSVEPDDTRHRYLWRSLHAQSDNVRTVVTIRSSLMSLWEGKRPTAMTRDQLLRLLLANEPSSRATADFLLRALYGNGPAFNINASAQNRQRTATAWRSMINQAGM